VNAKFDYLKMKQEIVEDEKIFKAKPILLTQREIQAILVERKSKDDRRRTS